MITLAAPWMLLLLPVPLAIHFLVPPRKEERDAVYAPFVDRLANVLGLTPERGAVISRRRMIQALFFVLAWGLVVAGIARPQWVGEPVTRTVPTRDLLLAIDLSGSMETKDFTDDDGVQVDRLTAVKQVLDGFLSRREGDRVGLIFFGTAAFVQSPFTEDLEVCRLLLNEAQVRMAGPRTVVGDSIGLAINVFEESELEERVLILLTDGNDTGSRIPTEKAASIAKDRGITIHAVAVSDPSAAGEEQLDEQALREIASTTGGIYAHAADREELESVYERLDALDTRDVETQSHRPRDELYVWPVGIFLVLTLAFFSLLHLPAWLSTRRSGQTG